MKTQPLNLILLGEPAAGKATQAKLIAQRYRLYDFDMGKELRRIQKLESESKAARDLNKTIDQGKLAPSKLVRKILEETIKAAPTKKGILFDGHPKMLGEARLAAKWLKVTKRSKPLVLYISIPLAETVRRASVRREYFRGKWSHRPDDTAGAIRNRVRYYRTNIAQVVNFFKQHYTYKKINGLGTVPEVHQRMVAAIEEFVQNRHN